jgi:hypothetical protein
VTSRVHPQQHKQPTNTTTVVMEPLAPPAAWIHDTMPPKVQAALRIHFPRPLLKGLVKFIKLK